MCFAGAQQAMDITSGPVTGGQSKMARGLGLIMNAQQAAAGDQGAQQRLATFRTNFAAAYPAAAAARRAAVTGGSGGTTGGGGGY